MATKLIPVQSVPEDPVQIGEIYSFQEGFVFISVSNQNITKALDIRNSFV